MRKYNVYSISTSRRRPCRVSSVVSNEKKSAAYFRRIHGGYFLTLSHMFVGEGVQFIDTRSWRMVIFRIFLCILWSIAFARFRQPRIQYVQALMCLVAYNGCLFELKETRGPGRSLDADSHFGNRVTSLTRGVRVAEKQPERHGKGRAACQRGIGTNAKTTVKRL